MHVDCYPEAPSEWPRKTVGEVAAIDPAYRLEVGKAYPFVEMASVREGFGGIDRFEQRIWDRSGLCRFKENDLMLGKITPCAENGKAALVSDLPDNFGIGSTEFFILSPNAGIVPEFLFAAVTAGPFHRRLVSRMEGSTGRLRITRDTLKKWLALPVPPPDEQHRIAAALKLADDAIQKARAELDATRKLRRSAAFEMIEKGVPGRHTNFLPTKHWTYSAGWDLVCVKHLLTNMDAGSSPMCEADPAKPGQWGVLKVSAVSWDRFEEFENKALPATIEPELAAEVKLGDIIVSRANTTELCGAVHRVHSLYTRLLLCDKTWRLHPKDDVNPDWLVAALKHPAARKQIEANATGTSDSMKNIAKRDFRNVVVPRPSKPEQDEIADVLNAIDAQVETQERKVRALNELKRSLLQNLLTGKIRIPDEAIHV